MHQNKINQIERKTITGISVSLIIIIIIIIIMIIIITTIIIIINHTASLLPTVCTKCPWMPQIIT